MLVVLVVRRIMGAHLVALVVVEQADQVAPALMVVQLILDPTIMVAQVVVLMVVALWVALIVDLEEILVGTR
jgi:hypothetical protein